MQSYNLLLLAGSGTRWAQLLVALSILIILHEFGHFFFARLFKTRVEKFYLFFDFLFPFSGLFNFALFKKKVGGTEYGIGWFPLGGYVKIAGMVDESMDKEELAKPPQPWEYRSKPAWQRLFIMLGGIIFNILVAIIVYSFVFGIWGEQYLPAANAKYGIVTDSLGHKIGLKNGDKIVSVGGKPVTRFKNIFLDVTLNGAKTIEVERNGTPLTIDVQKGTVRSILKNQSRIISPRMPAVVDEVTDKSEASRMGLKRGDSIIAINDQPIQFHDQLQEKLSTLKSQPLRMVVVRNGNQIVPLSGNVDSTGTIGFYPYPYSRFLKVETIHYNPIQAVGKGFTYTFEQFGFYWKQFKMIFASKEVKLSETLGGFGSFAKIFPTEFDIMDFMNLLAFISIILAFMNLLPIPGLDGGYVVFTLWEMITGKKASDKVMEVATTIGLVLLLALMVYANGLDIFRAFRK